MLTRPNGILKGCLINPASLQGVLQQRACTDVGRPHAAAGAATGTLPVLQRAFLQASVLPPTRFGSCSTEPRHAEKSQIQTKCAAAN